MAKEEKIINYNNKRENAKRVEYDYDSRYGNYRKLEGGKIGPFRITQVHNDGFIIIRRVIVNEKNNIWCLTQYFGDPPT